ncbi:hypothetical protein EHS25_000665 [Saitozyma podzolica]|uniref:Protein CPL1-like domain-containing protein n=1 Tax=Saitozyma podzolica TaxID=1890683 RepID=A0A427YWQ4_9TREE|nr:hypothetical protein EHS25_000665 [Saitozyma podzolica]
MPPQGTYPWSIVTAVSDPYPCFTICSGLPYVAIRPLPTSFLCQCGPTLPATSYAACSPSVNFYYGGDVMPSAGMRRRKELALKTGEEKGLCPAGLEACSVLGIPGGYECLDTASELESCGGCLHQLDGQTSPANQGVDCQEVPGVPVGAITCQDGECEAFGCDDGYALVDGYCFEE